MSRPRASQVLGPCTDERVGDLDGIRAGGEAEHRGGRRAHTAQIYEAGGLARHRKRLRRISTRRAATLCNWRSQSTGMHIDTENELHRFRGQNSKLGRGDAELRTRLRADVLARPAGSLSTGPSHQSERAVGEDSGPLFSDHACLCNSTGHLGGCTIAQRVCPLSPGFGSFLNLRIGQEALVEIAL